MHFARVLLLISLLALIVVPTAYALRFTDEDFEMPIGEVGQLYTKQFTGGAGCGPALPYQYRVLAGTLPPGISFSRSGLFSGVPTNVGSWSFWVELSDQNPPSASWCVPRTSQREFTITVVRSTTATTEIGRPLHMPLAPAASKLGFTWSVALGMSLPAGLSLDPLAGVISGKPAEAGSFSVDLVLSDGHGSTSTLAVNLVVARRLAVSPSALPVVRAHRAYSARLKSVGGVGPEVWRILRGALPSGIRLNPNTGKLAGTARRAVRRRVTVQVSDSLGAVSTSAIAIHVVR
jgi:hypothetical protein